MQDVILLHGALGCKSHWDHVLPYLDKDFRIHNLNFPLHGGEASGKKELELQDLTAFLKNYVEEQQLQKFMVVGYSMGGYVALALAIDHLPGMERLITIGTKLNWSPEIAEEEISKLSIESLTPIHEKLEREHGAQWQDVVSATHSIMRSIGKAPIRKEQMQAIKIPVQLMLGEKDKMVTVAETQEFASVNPVFIYEMLPAQPHLLERIDAQFLAGRINSILVRQTGGGTV